MTHHVEYGKDTAIGVGDASYQEHKHEKDRHPESPRPCNVHPPYLHSSPYLLSCNPHTTKKS